MMDINEPLYDGVRGWIRRRRLGNWSWNEIRTLRTASKQELERQFASLKTFLDFPPELTLEEWNDIVAALEEIEKREKNLDNSSIMVTDRNVDNGAMLPEDPKSSWVLYKEHLRKSGWREDSIDEIESSTIKTLRRLNIVEGSPTVKGMVVGYVQSGKTANMAALMAMAADNGCNMFIVLSGTIENLRRQTQNRLYRDLNHHGNLVWSSIDHPSLHSATGQKLHELDLGPNRRYFTVCLKNSKRLEDLIKWLQHDPNKLQKLKIVVIDDEADQGGINTANISANERSKINWLIVNLVEGRRPDGSPFPFRPACMNYIGFTATPYANFLNESERESLYPRNFIRALKPSDEYIGAKQIFGIEGNEEHQGMNIVRDVPPGDVEQIKKLHSNQSADLSQSLVDALLWFICAAASMRRSGYRRKAISMLVHTSQKQVHHDNVALAIKDWLESQSPDDIVGQCRRVWERETRAFTKSDFKKCMPNYPDADAISDYPDFDEIVPHIKELISTISPIPLNEDGLLEYHKGIHLCIDNCSYNVSRDEDVYVRLAYPDTNGDNYPEPAPVFIVVGGSTLSRGLTIEGLVSTYFLRAANQADSLMQMGRWFGYRRGYELYPRIWMTEETRSKFEFLTQLEEELREDLRRFMHANEDPSLYGPRVKNSPKVTWLRITARNRMQSAVPAEMDFSGSSAQTVIFSKDAETLQKNILTADTFLAALGTGTPSFTGDSVVWRNVPFSRIKENFLKKFLFHPNAFLFNNIDAFCDWYEKAAAEAGFADWNVIAAGTKAKDASKTWEVPGGPVGKVNRSKKKRNREDNAVNIGVLRAPKDLFEDIEPERATEFDRNFQAVTASKVQVMKIRELAGLGKTPLMILYRIDKDSEPPAEGEGREKLDVPHDIIGVSIWIPGVQTSRNLGKVLTVKILREHIDNDDETGEEDAD